MKFASLLRRSLCMAVCVMLLTAVFCVSASAVDPKVYASVGDTVQVTAETLNIRQGPGSNYIRLGTLGNGYTAMLQKIDGEWGKIDAGWINLNYVRVNGKSSDNGFVPKDTYSPNNAYVTADFLNIRQGPGTNYVSLGLLGNGTRVFIQKKEDGWGKIDAGWIDLDYVNYYGSSSSSGTTVTSGSRVRVIADSLNVRQGAGTGYNRVGLLNNGEIVDILETRGDWGRTRNGWICLTYTTPVSTSVSSTSAPANTPAAGGSTYHKITAGTDVEVTAANLRVRLGTGEGSKIMGYLAKGSIVNVIEVAGGWGRIQGGWIDLDYVRPL